MEKPQNFILTIKYRDNGVVKVDTTIIPSGTSLWKLTQLKEKINREYNVTILNMSATPNKRHDKLLMEKKDV